MSRSALCLIVSVALLFAIGLLMIFNTTAAEILDRSLDMNLHVPLLRQMTYGLVGLGVGLFAYFYGYARLLRLSFPLLIVATLLLVFVFFPPLGHTINGAHRWVGIGKYTFQPSECIKILIPLAFIHWMSKQQQPISLKPFLKMLSLFSIPIGLILLEPDNGTTAIIFALLVILFLLTRIRLAYWAWPLLILVGSGAALASQMPHVHDRIRIYLHPELDLRGKGHQPYQAKIATGSGKLLGRGLGESLQKLNYLPEARSDYIAAIYAEECGFIGILGLIALYLSFTCAGFLVAIRAQDYEGFLLAAILTFLIALQAFLNLGIVSGLLPSKGMTLPFFSAGGSSLIINITALFLLLDIARRQKKIVA